MRVSPQVICSLMASSFPSDLDLGMKQEAAEDIDDGEQRVPIDQGPGLVAAAGADKTPVGDAHRVTEMLALVGILTRRHDRHERRRRSSSAHTKYKIGSSRRIRSESWNMAASQITLRLTSASRLPGCAPRRRAAGLIVPIIGGNAGGGQSRARAGRSLRPRRRPCRRSHPALTRYPARSILAPTGPRLSTANAGTAKTTP